MHNLIRRTVASLGFSAGFREVAIATSLTAFAFCQPAAARIIAVAGYQSANDRFQHAISATDDGALHEIFFDPTRGKSNSELGCFGSVRAASGFYSSDDGIQHVILATNNGNIRELFFNSAIGKHSSLITNIPNVVSLAAFTLTMTRIALS